MCSKLKGVHMFMYVSIFGLHRQLEHNSFFRHNEFLELMITENQLLFACAMFSHLVIVNNCRCKHVRTTRVYMMLGRES